MTTPSAPRLYTDLAQWWPLISPPEEYEEEAATVRTLLSSAEIPVHHVLELGSGGGHNAAHLKLDFTLTLVDKSPDMLAMSQGLNPECEHLAGDMRTVRLDQVFDAVFIHDAIDYMITEEDLQQAIETAFLHCQPGGVAIFVPDHVGTTFTDITDHGGHNDHNGRGARYLSWSWDPDPTDNQITTEFVFLLRDETAHVTCVHDTHVTGFFSQDVWIRLLSNAGFHPEAIIEHTSEDRAPRTFFIAHRPNEHS